MIITGITAQQKTQNRVNVMVDGAFRFSLDIFQVGDLGIKVGKEYSDQQLTQMETESQFGKLYGRAHEYCLMRPHSAKEVRDYLYRKTRDSRTKTGDIKPGVAVVITERVYSRLVEKGYIDDEKFALFWIENRNQIKGISRRKMTAELRAKGVEQTIIEVLLQATERGEEGELQKVIKKKQARYPDQQKFIQYLMRQGFRYDDIRSALVVESDV
jgi:regulatory protein